MLPIISERQGDRVKIEVTVDLSGSMLDAEESILRAVNAVGNVATGEALKRFDAAGDPIVVGGAKWYSKGKLPKIYNTPLELFRWSVMFINPPKAARPSARWTMGRGSSERRRRGLPRSCRTNLRAARRRRLWKTWSRIMAGGA